MKLVYQDLVEKRIANPTVCGLLCQGENLNTYRMAKLSKVTLCRNIEELHSLPAFIYKLVQVRVRVKCLIKTFIFC